VTARVDGVGSVSMDAPPVPRERQREDAMNTPGKRMSLQRCVTRLAIMIALLVLFLPSGMSAAAQRAASATSGPTTRSASADDVWTVRRFSTDEPVMALTFDCGSDRGYAEQILDTLADEGVRASFGMTGIWAEDNPDLVQRMVDEGHTLINHTYDHKSWTGYSTNTAPLSSAQRAQELHRTEQIVRDLTGAELQPFFRPPYGDYDNSVLADLADNGYTVNVMWSIDTMGWNRASVSQITSSVLNGAGSGVIVLMHVGADSDDAVALPGMIDQLRDRGYHFATVRDFVEGTLGASRYFPETGQWISHGFLAYWRQYGGLPIFGYPLTGEFDQDGRVIQYFERARFEWSPGAWPARYDVLLGRLGAELTADRTTEAPFRPIVAGNDQHCTFYAPTGHRLCFGFRSYWEQHGGLAIFGYPLSEEFKEQNPDTGAMYTVQYFERARFEWHPENAGTPYAVLLGRLGAQVLAAEQ
jgi:peptidoglycan/xylan/chitin deacetylase (PgdA/CDA1 family)